MQQRVDLSDRHWAHSAEQFSLWPLAAGLSHGLGGLYRDSAHCCPFFDLDLVCFGDRRDVSGILSTCQLKLLWTLSQQSKRWMLPSRAWTDTVSKKQLSKKWAVCVIDTGSLRAKRTMLVNERLRKTEKEEEMEKEKEGWSFMQTLQGWWFGN